MGTPLTWSIVFTVAMVLGPRLKIEARQCVLQPDVEQLFIDYSTVFVGTALSNTSVPGPEDGVQNIGVLRAERFWKGIPTREVHVGSDLPFRVGERYFVFASGEPLATTIACEATQPVSKSMKKRLWLSKRPSRPAG